MFLRTTNYFTALPSISLYYKVLLGTSKYYMYHSATHKKSIDCADQLTGWKTMEGRHSCLIAVAQEPSSTLPRKLWDAKCNGTTTFIFDSHNAGNIQYLAPSNLWDAKHNGTTSFMFSRNTWKVQYIARINLWCAKHWKGDIHAI